MPPMHKVQRGHGAGLSIPLSLTRIVCAASRLRHAYRWQGWRLEARRIDVAGRRRGVSLPRVRACVRLYIYILYRLYLYPSPSPPPKGRKKDYKSIVSNKTLTTSREGSRLS